MTRASRGANDVTRPPRFSEWLLRCILRGKDNDVVLGDLREDFAHEVRVQGVRSARSWYRREAWDLIRNLGWSSNQPSVEELRAQRRARLASAPDREDFMNIASPAGLLQDLRYAARALGRDRSLLLLGTLILGVGIAASTAIFSVVRPLLLQPLPFPEAERLVWVENVAHGGLSGRTSRTSNLADYRRSLESFESVGGYFAFFRGDPVVVTGDGEPETLIGVPVTHDFLDTLGVRLQLGSDFGPEVDDLGVGESSDVVISHALWQRRFGGARDVVGDELMLNGRARQIIGVLPSSFDFSSIFEPDTQVDLLTPFPVNERSDRWGNTLSIVGRLAPEASLDSAAIETERLLQSLREEEPRRWGLGGQLSGLRETIARPYRSAYLLLVGSALVMLLIVSVNLSNLLLAKSPLRAYEMSVRAAHGAPASRILRQLVFESVLLATAGAVLGAGLAIAVVKAVAATTAISIPLLETARVDAQVLLVSLSLALVVGSLVGLAPALQVVRSATLVGRRGAQRGATGGRWNRRLREALVVTQVGLACALVVLGALLLGSFRQLLDVDLGFEVADGWVWKVQAAPGLESLADVNGWFEDIQNEVKALPGVERVGLTDDLPFGDDRSWGVNVPGQEFDEPINAYPHIVSHDYLEAMRIRVLDGRGFELQDTEESQPVAVINETAQRTLFPEGALGRELAFGDSRYEVVGVTRDIRHQRLDQPAALQVYLSMRQVFDFGALDLVVFSQLPEEVLANQVGAALRRVDDKLPIGEYRSLRGVMGDSISARRFTLTVLSAFAAVALFLAALGIYGVLSNLVTEQRREIGIRMALGESSRGVLSRVVGRTVAMALVGVTLGALGLVPTRRTMESLLFEVSPTDPRVFLGTAALLVVVATVAGLVPALRAARTNSAEVLKP